MLSYFFPEGAASFQQQAKDASNSRVYARIHYRFDTDNGLIEGTSVGGYATNAALLDGAH